MRKPKKILSDFIVMQRIDRLLLALPDRERAGVLAWLKAKHFAEPEPRAAGDNGCKHPGFGS